MSAVIRRTRTSIDSLNSSELLFVKHLIADDLWRPIEAAKKAGFKSPSAMASNLMKKPAVQAALGKEQRRRLERLELRADEVLHVLATGLFFNPLSLFKVGASGRWVVEDLDKVPDEIGRIVEEVRVKSVESLDESGNLTVTTYFELRTISKTRLLELAMKHCGVDGSTKIEHSGSVGVEVGLSGGLSNLLMEIEKTRSHQIIDGTVVDKRIADE